MTPRQERYLEDLQCTAMLLQTMLDAINACISNPARNDLAVTLLESAMPISAEITDALDRSRFEREGQA